MLDKALQILEVARWSPFAKVLSADVLGIPMPEIKTLIGDQWAKAYPGNDPLPHEPLHQGMLMMIDRALHNISERLTSRSSEERTKAKEEARHALDHAPKRRRGSPPY